MVQCRRARSVGRPPKKPVVGFHGFVYRAARSDRGHRAVIKVEWYFDEVPARRNHRDQHGRRRDVGMWVGKRKSVSLGEVQVNAEVVTARRGMGFNDLASPPGVSLKP